MSTCLHKRIPAIAALIAPLLLGYGHIARATTTDAEPAAPLAPYFFVEGGDSGVDRLPLKKTSAAVRLNQKPCVSHYPVTDGS